MVTVETEFPLWVLIFERIGPGSCVLVFTLAVLWKLLPAVIRLLGAWRRQSERVTDAVDPVLDGMKDAVWHLERIADHVTGAGTSARDPGGGGIRLGRRRSDPPGSGSSGLAPTE